MDNFNSNTNMDSDTTFDHESYHSTADIDPNTKIITKESKTQSTEASKEQSSEVSETKSSDLSKTEPSEVIDYGYAKPRRITIMGKVTK